MNLSAPFIKRPVMTTFVMLTIVLAGWFAFVKLPVNDLPVMERPNIKVKAGYIGASSDTMLNLVTIPLEKELTHVKGIHEMRSTSSPGYTSISLDFDLSKDMDEAIRDVQSALNRAAGHLPYNLDPRPAYELEENSQEPIMWFLITSDELSVGDMRSYADSYVLPRLNRLEGVAQVKVYGAQKSIWVRVNPELMAVRRIDFNQIADTIKQKTSQTPLGSIQTTSKLLSIELPSANLKAKDLENLKIGDTDIRIKDVGEVVEKSDEDMEFHFVNQNKSSLALIFGVQKVSDGNTVAIAKSVRNVLSAIEKELPSSMRLTLWFDKSVWIEESLVDMQWTLMFAFFLVVLVIYLSLGRFSESLITSSALPLSLLGTFIIMYLLGFSLDLLSLLALTLSVGFVVDDAIVVLENIVRHQENGEPPREASLTGSKQICFTILSMTLSLVAVFIPLLFMSGMNGRLFREFSITLSAAILVSGFVSLTLTPMLCSRFLSVHKGENRLQKGIAQANSWMVGLYGRTLKRCFKYPKSILTIALGCIIATVYLFSMLPVNLIPGEDRGFFFAFVNLPSGMSPEKVNENQKKLENMIKVNPHIEDLLSLNFGGKLMFLTRLYHQSQRPPQQEIIGQIQSILDAVPGTQTFIQPYQLINLDLDFGNAGQYKMIVKGMEFPDVEKGTEILVKAMQQHPEFSFVNSTLSNDSPMLAMELDEDLVHKLGFSKQDIQGLLQNAYGQGIVGKIQKGANEERIFMELLPEFQNHSDAPEKLYLTTPEGHPIPFKSFASWKEKLGSPNLTRRDQLPSATIRFSLAEGIHPNRGLEHAEKVAKEALPENVTGELAGAAKAVSTTIRDTLFLLLAAAIVMYIVLGILYESFIHPLTILSSIPFAGLGGVLTLFLFNEPISIFSAVGFLLLIGIVKKNGIMVVDYAVEAQKLGSTPEKAIFDACLVRFRPIMMTTFAAIMGAIPIAIGFGDGSEMRRGLGLVIVGGLIFSQVLTLYVTPIIYLTFEQLFHRKKHKALANS
jgi:hydrophobic/amphiphilic exporter-1 (mainly G- bacteria), HAE1 family